MKERKFLAVLLCSCVFALCVAVWAVAYEWRESREELTLTQRQLEETREQLAATEAQLAQVEAQLAQTQEDKEKMEKERDYAQSHYESISRRDNPIDQYYFSDKRVVGSTTVEMGVESAFYYEAWRQELAHAVSWVKRVSEYEEDHRLLDNYQTLIEAQAEMAYEITLLRGAGDYAPGDERGRNRQFILGTYGGVGTTFSAAEAYRQGTLWLLDTYCYVLDYHFSGYSFGFDEDFIAEIYGTESEEFPPLSQVLPDQF